MKKKILIMTLLVLIIFQNIGYSQNILEEDIEEIGVEVPVLIYHHLSDEVTSDVIVTAEKFEEDMITLKEAGYEGIFLEELVAYLQGEGQLPEKPILITFDDGYYSNYEYAYPIAKKHDMKITISMIGWSVGRESFIYEEASIIPHFDYVEAKEMLDSGYVDLQSHTYDLHSPEGFSYGGNNIVNQGVMPLDTESLPQYKKRLTMDLVKFNYQMYFNVKKMPKFLFYPYGAYNEVIESFLEDLGFQGSFLATSGLRRFETMADLKKVPRFNVNNDLRGKDLLEAIDNLEIK